MKASNYKSGEDKAIFMPSFSFIKKSNKNNGLRISSEIYERKRLNIAAKKRKRSWIDDGNLNEKLLRYYGILTLIDQPSLSGLIK